MKKMQWNPFGIHIEIKENNTKLLIFQALITSITTKLLGLPFQGVPIGPNQEGKGFPNFCHL
jgi:hypothetical protein